MFAAILFLHVLGATVWTGGHLVLAATVLPRAMRERSVAELQRFEAGYERIGIPALLLQVVTGLWLAQRLVPDPARWFDPGDPLGRLPALAWHVVPVTILSVLFVLAGTAFRTGLLA